MPSFEQLSQAKSNIRNHRTYDRIIATFRSNSTDQTVASRSDRVTVSLKDTESYDYLFSTIGSDKYAVSAGSDLSAIFMPYKTQRGATGFPSFYVNAPVSGVVASGSAPNMVDQLPIQWNETKSTVLLDRYSATEGDSLPHMISDTQYRGSVDQFRDISNTRGVGFRLPAMGVGWGYTTDGRPWPSGNWNAISTSGFKAGSGVGNLGWMVDPADYIAAPLDFRYDRRNNVWTSPKGFWASITGSGYVGSTIKYAWKEKIVGTSGTLTDPPTSAPWYRQGTTSGNPAFEVNNRSVPSGTNVWIQLAERTDNLQFEFGGGGSLPVGQYQRMIYQMVSQNQAGWDFARSHGLL